MKVYVLSVYDRCPSSHEDDFAYPIGVYERLSDAVDYVSLLDYDVAQNPLFDGEEIVWQSEFKAPYGINIINRMYYIKEFELQ